MLTINKTQLIIKALWITSLAFLLSWVMMAPFSVSMSALFSMPEKNDFTISDFYTMVADGRALSHLDSNIVIVNLDDCGRNEIAGILNKISTFHPAAVIVDVIFADARPTDDTLLEALAQTHNLVLPITLQPVDDSPQHFRIVETSWFYDSADKDYYASSALVSKYDNSMVRSFRSYYQVDSVGVFPTLALAAARLVDPEAEIKLRKRNHEYELIRFHSRRFLELEPSEIDEYQSQLEGKIFILGAKTERGDLHPTPVNSLTPGVEIHAHTLATILDESYMTSVSPRWEWVISILLCFIIVVLALRLTGKIRGFIIRMVQIVLLYGIIQIGYYVFVKHDMVYDLTMGLMMIAFGLFATDLWNGAEAIYHWAQIRLRARRIKNYAIKNDILDKLDKKNLQDK